MAKNNKSPRTWRQLIEIKDLLEGFDGKDIRLPEDQRFYEIYVEMVPKDIALGILKRLIDKPVSLIQNNFPYTRTLKYLPSVKHYCLWSLKGKLTDKEIKKYVERAVDGKEWIYCERRLNKRSVPEIWHCHVFVKEK